MHRTDRTIGPTREYSIAGAIFWGKLTHVATNPKSHSCHMDLDVQKCV